MIAPEIVAELQLLAQRAEASVDASMGTAKYSSTRNVATLTGGRISPPFNMFAISVAADDESHPDIMFCRTPEIAKFIVALLNFGGAVVAECSEKDTRAAIEKELSLVEIITGVDRNDAWPGQRKP